MHSIPGKALAAGISSGISRSEGSGIHTQRSKPGAFWDNNFPKKKKNLGGRKPTWMLFLIGFIQNSRNGGNFFGLGIRGLSTKAARKNVDHGLSSQLIPQNYNRQLLSTTPTGIFLSNQVFLEKNWELLTTAPLDIPELGKIPQNFNVI